MKPITMIEKNTFALLTKQSAKSFNDQKALIKKVLAGRIMLCEKCQQPLKFTEYAEANKGAVIACHNACTDIELDVVK